MSDVGGPVSPDDHEDVPTVGSTSSEDPAPAPAPTPEQQPDKTPAEGEDLAPSKDASLPSQPVPTAPSPAVPASSTSDAAPRPSPAPRRPKPPTKGILKPPPPPPKPTLGNRIRDIVTSSVSVVGGGAKSLFDPAVETDSSIAGPSSRAGPSTTSPQSMSATVGGTLNALSGRLGMGFSRLVAGSPSPSATSTPSSSPMSSRTIPLPETGGVPAPMSEKSRQKQPLRRATFLLPTLSITYPISSQGEPWSQKVLDDRRRVSRNCGTSAGKRLTRAKQIESLHRTTMSTSSGAEYWNSTRLVALYENACRIREERPRVGIVRALEVSLSRTHPFQAVDGVG
jgi:protein phosphatase 1 regulatory subunit 37